MSIQSAFMSQLCCPNTHSSTSREGEGGGGGERESRQMIEINLLKRYKERTDRQGIMKCSSSVPVQFLTPSPAYPAIQVHSKLPIVSVQLAFTSQLCIPLKHSSTSVRERKSIQCTDHHRQTILHTHAAVSVSSVAWATDTVVTANSVHAIRVVFANVSP